MILKWIAELTAIQTIYKTFSYTNVNVKSPKRIKFQLQFMRMNDENMKFIILNLVNVG